MWNLLNPDNRFVQIITKFAYGVVISLLWALLSCTIIGFGPAATALYHTSVKVLRKDRGALFSEFFGSIKGSWKATIPAGLLALVLLGSLALIDLPNLAALVTNKAGYELLSCLFSLVKCLVCISFMLYAFPIFSRFQVGLVRGCLFSLVIAIRHLPSTLLLCTAAAAAVFLFWLQPLLIFGLPVCLSLFQSLLMEKILIAHMSEDDRTAEAGKDLWYMPDSK